MAIQVICPGCMRRFEVADRFAGKKGPCPRCGHIIEIPKEQVVVHAPDEMIIEGRKVKNPDFVRPIERSQYAFTRGQIIANFVGALVLLLGAYLFHFLGVGVTKWVAGTLGIFVAAFALARSGYILVRNPDDLEMFLGNRLNKKAVIVALGYTAAWLIFEILFFIFDPGFYFFVILLPITILASFIPLVVFDTDYGDSFMLFVIFVLCVVLLRGIMFAPEGWIWQKVPPRQRQRQVIEAKEAVSAVAGEDIGEALGEVGEGVVIQSSGELENSAGGKHAKKLDKAPPKPNIGKKR